MIKLREEASAGSQSRRQVELVQREKQQLELRALQLEGQVSTLKQAAQTQANVNNNLGQ